MVYFDQEHPRIFRDDTFQLRRNDTETVLGSLAADVVKRYKVPFIITEVLMITAVVAGFFLFVCWGEVGFYVVAGVVMGFGFLQGVLMASMMFFLWQKTKQGCRFVLSKDGAITVKNEQHEDVRLLADEPIEFLCVSDNDRDGREVFDVLLRNGRDQYYLLSGRDRDDMERLRDALEKLLHSPASAPLG